MTIRYENQELQDKLAVEYVMGSLQGQARRRFEKLVIEYPDLQSSIAKWSELLNYINQDVEPVTPPLQIWTNIEQSIDSSRTESPFIPPLWKNLGLIAATMLLAVTLVYNVPIYQPQQNVVVVMNKNDQPVWVIKNSAQSKQIKVKTLRSMNMPENEVCVLWLVWKDGKTQSVGVLSDDPGERTIMLPTGMKRKLEMADIAVSIENMNSNMEQPKGKVVFKGPWIEL